MLTTNEELVQGARSGDRAAIRTIHDRCCGRIYDHCSAVLRDPDLAATVLLDTFMLAFVELYRLRDPAKLEPWLFALARDQMLFQPRSPVVMPDPDDVHESTSTRERALAWQAAAWFPRRDRILLDLQVRQRLELRELADATGVSVAHAHAVSSRLEAEVNRLVGALLVARFARECRGLRVVPEHAFDPRVTMRRFAHHVDRCSRCSKARQELPAATDLIASIPGEAEPPELRGEALERVHLVLRELEASAGGGTQVLVPVPDAPDDEADRGGDEVDDALGPDLDAEAGEYEFDDYDVVLELTPPPVPLTRDGFPRSLFPERRRLVAVVAALVTGVVALALAFDGRGVGSGSDRLLAAAARQSAARTPPTTAPPVTTVPVEATAPDTTAPSVASLARRYACIGPAQPTTDVLVTVSDDRALASVDVIVSHDVQGATRKRMTASGGQYVAEVGPYQADGTVTWTVEATDAAGNPTSRQGPLIAARATC